MTRIEWALSGLLAFLVIAVTVLLLLFWSERRQQGAAEDAPLVVNEAGSPASVPTAQTAVRLAAPVAQQWAEDAQLYSALATWPDGTTFTPADTGWTLLYYSPASGATAQIGVNAGRAVLLTSHTTDAQLQPVALDGWSVDSPQAVDLLLDNGGQTFIDAHGDVGLTLTLNANGVLRWRARLIDAESGDSLHVEIDPHTEAIVDSTTSTGNQ
jgi:hypothetical protein